MVKETGLGFRVAVDDPAAALQDISNDVNNFNFATPRGVQDTTGVDKSAMERLLLLADFSATLNGTFNDGLNASHDVFSDLDGARTTELELSNQLLSVEALATDYALTRNQEGSFVWSVPLVLADGTVPTWSTT